MSTDGGVDKKDMVHINNEILHGQKEEWNNVICSNMNKHWDCLDLVKKVRQRQISYDITYMWNLKKKRKVQVNLSTKQKNESQI